MSRQPAIPTRPLLILGLLMWLGIGWCAWKAEYSRPAATHTSPDVGKDPR